MNQEDNRFSSDNNNNNQQRFYYDLNNQINNINPQNQGNRFNPEQFNNQMNQQLNQQVPFVQYQPQNNQIEPLFVNQPNNIINPQNQVMNEAQQQDQQPQQNTASTGTPNNNNKNQDDTKKETKKKFDSEVFFFRNEQNWLLAKTIITWLLFFGIIGLIGYFAYETSSVGPHPSWFSKYYLIPTGFGALIFFILAIYISVKLGKWKKIVSTLGQNDENNSASFHIVSFYKTLTRTNIFINWLCGYIYFVYLLSILLCFILSYLVHIYVFGGLDSNVQFGQLNWSDALNASGILNKVQNPQVFIEFSRLPVVCLFFGGIISAAVLVFHIVTVSINSYRKRQLANSFGNIILKVDLSQSISRWNKINLIIYGTITIIFILAILIFIILSKKIFK